MPTAQAKTKIDFLAQPKPEDHIKTRADLQKPHLKFMATVDVLARSMHKVQARTTLDFFAWPMHEVLN